MVGIKNRVYNLCDQSRNAADWPEKYFDESWRSSHTKKPAGEIKNEKETHAVFIYPI
jgi:hypothetical protein